MRTAAGLFLRQTVIHRGISFEIKLPEIAKGIEDTVQGRLYSVLYHCACGSVFYRTTDIEELTLCKYVYAALRDAEAFQLEQRGIYDCAEIIHEGIASFIR